MLHNRANEKLSALLGPGVRNSIMQSAQRIAEPVK
jgi:hypothetical protein